MKFQHYCSYIVSHRNVIFNNITASCIGTYNVHVVFYMSYANEKTKLHVLTVFFAYKLKVC